MRCLLLASLLMLGLLSPLEAAGKRWVQSGAEAFSEGQLHGVSVLSTGELVLAPKVERIEGLKANYVWDIAPAGDGAAYIGTGAPASVYRLREGELKLLHTTSEQAVSSVLALPDGSVLAATLPRGIIFRIDPAGQVTVFEDLTEHYVWDMSLGPKGEIYCATGPNGRLLRLDGGEVKELFRAPQRHLLCLAVDSSSGDIYAGTEPDGLVYRIKPDGTASVLFDAEEEGVKTLTLGGGGKLYVGTAQAEFAQAPQRSQPGAEPSAPHAPPPSAESEAFPGKPSGANSLYLIRPGEGAMRLARFEGALVLSTALAHTGEVFVGTGVEGRLVGVSDRGVTRIVTDFDAQHVSAMVAQATGEVLVGTSNGGGLWRLGAGYRPKGTFTSEVFDAGYLARWGRIWWRGRLPEHTSVRLSLRTGNVHEPDATWSGWAELQEEGPEGLARVPAGRFAQLRAVLRSGESAESPALLELGASYRQANRPPRVQTLVIDDSEQAGSGARGPRPPRRAQTTEPGKRTIRWEASDPNGDPLVFDLYYRGVDELEWKALKKGIREQDEYEWDTRRVPDGQYVLRLVASDRFSRSDPLEGERLTAPFVIDNTPPHVLKLKWAMQQDGSCLITGWAMDEHSNIASLEVSRNSGDWEPVFPDDGIFDARAEPFTYRSEKLAAGEHVFVFAATDAAHNTGSAKVVVRVE